MRPDGLQVRQRSGERAARPAVDVQVSPADGPVDAVAVCMLHIQRLITRDRERTAGSRHYDNLENVPFSFTQKFQNLALAISEFYSKQFLQYLYFQTHFRF